MLLLSTVKQINTLIEKKSFMYNTMHLYKFLAVLKPELYASAVQLYSI